MTASKFLVVLAFPLLALGGCANDRFIGGSEVRLTAYKELPEPTVTDGYDSKRPYLIAPFDRISIDVFGIPELTKDRVLVDGAGKIALPVAGEIEVGGKSTTEAANIIAMRLRSNFVRDPKVAVNTQEVSQTITIEGSVVQPGQYPVLGRMSLLRAVASARGLSENANTDYVVVFRRVNNQQLAALFDLRSIRRGVYSDPVLYPNDIVSVGESRARSIFKTLVQSSGLLSIPILLLR